MQHAVDLAGGDDGARAGSVERGHQLRLPPKLREHGDDEAGAMRGKHRQHELDGVRQLHRNHRMARQAGLGEMRRECRDRAVGLGLGQLSWRLARDALLVGRIDQRKRIGSARQDALEQDVEGR